MKKGNIFYLILQGNCFEKGHVVNISTELGWSAVVVKFIKDNRWNRFLRKLGFDIKIGQYKMKML